MRSADPATDLPPAALPFEALFRAAPVPASISRERDGCLLAVNDAWLAMTGLRAEDVIGRTTVALGHWPSEADRQA
jgi:PAS domain S-box-containing protein